MRLQPRSGEPRMKGEGRVDMAGVEKAQEIKKLIKDLEKAKTSRTSEEIVTKIKRLSEELVKED